MSLTLYEASIPRFTRMLRNLAAILDKAEAHCEARKIDPLVLTQYRLYPDMFNLAKQVQVACDHARNGAARLTGQEAPRLENTETTFPELVARIQATIAYLETFTPDQFEGAETREVAVKRGETVNTYPALHYLLDRTLPNFYFHVTTAYDILRHNGVGLGKRDFIG